MVVGKEVIFFLKSFFGYLSNLCKMNKQPTFAHTRTWTLHDKNIIWRVTRIRILPCTRVTLQTYVCVKTAVEGTASQLFKTFART